MRKSSSVGGNGSIHGKASVHQDCDAMEGNPYICHFSENRQPSAIIISQMQPFED